MQVVFSFICKILEKGMWINTFNERYRKIDPQSIIVIWNASSFSNCMLMSHFSWNLTDHLANKLTPRLGEWQVRYTNVQKNHYYSRLLPIFISLINLSSLLS